MLRLTDALIAQGLPSHVEVVELAEGFAARASGLLEALAARYRGGDCNLPAEVLPIEHVGGAHLRLRDGYDLHVRGRFGGSDRPVVLLHGAGESVRPLEPLTTRVAPQHPVVALDLPGHGGSPGRVEMQTVQELSGLAIAAIDHLGFREAHLVGHELGAQIALEIAARAPGLVRSVLAIGLPLLEPDERPSLHRHYLPDLSPRWDGAHLITAWQMLRDRQLFWPWYQRTQAAAIDADPYLDPTYQQAQTLALLESLETLPGITRSMIDYDSSGAVAQPRCPIVLSAPPSDPFRARITALHAALPHTRRLDLPADPHAWWTPLGETLGALEVIRRGRR